MTFDSLEDEYSYFRELRDKPNGPDVRKDMFYFSRMIALQAKLDRVTELVEELGEALEDLLDHQNGCPLPKYEIPWNRAVESSRAALGHWRALKDGEK